MDRINVGNQKARDSAAEKDRMLADRLRETLLAAADKALKAKGFSQEDNKGYLKFNLQLEGAQHGDTGILKVTLYEPAFLQRQKLTVAVDTAD